MRIRSKILTACVNSLRVGRAWSVRLNVQKDWGCLLSSCQPVLGDGEPPGFDLSRCFEFGYFFSSRSKASLALG